MCAARYWLGTCFDFEPPLGLPERCCWLRGQQETCPTTGRLHYQLFAGFSSPVRRAHVARYIGAGHWEISRSVAAEQYVWKEATRVPDTQFELGAKPLKRNSAVDWESIRTAAVAGDLSLVPADVFVRHYFALQRISADNATPTPIVRTTTVFWGPTGSGKSRRAWDEAGALAYAKDPRTKWYTILILGGVDTRIRNMLLLMNFAERSTLATSYAGWIGIPCLWKLKAGLDLFEPPHIG